MSFIERARSWAGLALTSALAGCGVMSKPPAPPPPAPAATRADLPAPTAPAAVVAPHRPAPTPAPIALGPPRAVKTHDELRRQAAERLVAASPERSYLGRPPEILLAIPVLEVELRADGSVKRINVVRRPNQAEDTVQLAIDAIQRAAPYGDVRRMPEPWKFVETFLFDDERRFKPRTLD